MPDRPLREISRALATSTSPSLPGLMNVMSHCAATARSLCELQAKAKVESASRKMKPPWAMRWPLTMCGSTVIVSAAKPGFTSTIFMPRPLLASSSFHIASAQARAISSGESATFIAGCPLCETVPRRSLPVRTGLFVQASYVVSVGTKHRRCQRSRDSSYVVVVHDHLVRTWPRLAGQDKACLQFPRLQRIIDFHLRVALDQLGAAGRAHAALAGERQIHAGAQGGIQDGFLLGDRYL